MIVYSMNYLCLTQELHEAGETDFRLPGFARIPEWVDHQNMGHTISFWFRNKVPSMALCFSTTSVGKTGTFYYTPIFARIINRDEYGLGIMASHHTYLYDMKQVFEEKYSCDIFKNEWIHVEVTGQHTNVEPLTEIGIHFYKQKNNMDDIQLSNPYEKIKLNDNDDDGDDVFYDVDNVLDEDNHGVFYDVDDVLDDDVDDEDDHHTQ